MKRQKRSAFTMVELLVVSGILLILVAIGLSNFQTANTRTKMSVVMNDLRVMAEASEAYHVDHAAYPRMAHLDFFNDINLDIYKRQALQGNMSSVLSTPVAYVTEAHMIDPYMKEADNARLDERLYTYQHLPTYVDYTEKDDSKEFWRDVLSFAGEYRFASVGPNRVYDNIGLDGQEIPYDPTNGNLSEGNIWRTKNHGASIPLPPPTILPREPLP